MNVEIWHFPLCGLSVHMVYKDAQCAPLVGGMHTHYRRGDHWSPATNKTVSFIFHSPFSILHLAYAQNKKERAQRSLLIYSKGISPPFYLLCCYKPIRQCLSRFDGTLSIGKGARWVLTLLLSVRICYSVQQTGSCLISNYLLQFITASKRIPVHSRVLLLSPLW